MRKTATLVILAALLVVEGCGAKAVPRWRTSAFNYLEQYKELTLLGDTRSADLFFAKALEEIKKSGDLLLLGRIYLTQSALRTAIGEDSRNPSYEVVAAAEHDAANAAFYRFLQGSPQSTDIEVLPKAYSPFAKALFNRDIAGAERQISLIADPLSQAIAASIFIRTFGPREGVFLKAAETASSLGWKAVLLFHLNGLQDFYRATGNMAAADRILQRIALIAG